ncbi:MAG: hypothetical protein NZL93_02525, partial [Chthoniobacterales bacterium]|nr:hypothetical protein [Chthoniobacterales bacterium]
MDINKHFYSYPFYLIVFFIAFLGINLSSLQAQFSPYSSNRQDPSTIQSSDSSQQSNSTAEPTNYSNSEFAVVPQNDNGLTWAEELRRQPAKFYKFDRALLRDVLRFLAEEAGIPYILAPETVAEPRDSNFTEDIGISVGIGNAAQPTSSDQASQGSATESFRGQRKLPSDAISYDSLVTFTMRASPFVVLEAVAKANDIQVRYQDGVWVISRSPEMFYRRRVEERLKVRDELARLQATAMEQQVQFQRTLERISGTELVPRTYKLRHISPLPITITGGSGATGGSTASSPGSIPNLATQSSQLIYTTDIPTIIRDIRAILGLPVDISSSSSQTQVANTNQQQNQPQSPQNLATLLNGTTTQTNLSSLQQTSPSTQTSRSFETAVSYIPESNSIFVVATEEQHRRVALYLANVDREQPLVAIEVKFFETTKDPSKDLGVNWAGTFAEGGLGFRLSDASIGSSSGLGRLQYAEGVQRGDPGSGSPIPGLFNYRLVRNLQFEAPYTAVLSMSDVAFAINAFMQDRETSIVQYPRVLTVNNREVAISNAVNQPILGSSQQSQSSGTTQTTNTINYLPIGTQLNILPQVMEDGSVTM